MLFEGILRAYFYEGLCDLFSSLEIISIKIWPWLVIVVVREADIKILTMIDDLIEMMIII